MKAVVVIGSECTGKTTLAHELAHAYGTITSPEYARLYLDAKGPPLLADDVEPIARGQLAVEDEASAMASRLLFKDTDLVSTSVYARHYYGTCPRWIEDAARLRLGTLYLLMHPDVPWVADGAQRDRPAARQEVHALFAQVLVGYGADVTDIRGSWVERRAQARAAVDALLRAS
jgi:NadR type nicotinamide-nucleotide adenylyltransferase